MLVSPHPQPVQHGSRRREGESRLSPTLEGRGGELSLEYLGGRKKPDSGEQQLPQVFKVCLPAGVCLKPGLCTRRVWQKQGVKSVIHKTQVLVGHPGGTDCSHVKAPLEGQAVGAVCVQGMQAGGGSPLPGLGASELWDASSLGHCGCPGFRGFERKLFLFLTLEVASSSGLLTHSAFLSDFLSLLPELGE